MFGAWVRNVKLPNEVVWVRFVRVKDERVQKGAQVLLEGGRHYRIHDGAQVFGSTWQGSQSAAAVM